MRYIIMHKAGVRDEAGEKPTPELIATVGGMVGDMSRAGVLRGGEGLRPSSVGVRLRFKGGQRESIPGPFIRGTELAQGFVIVNVKSIDEAVEWATRYAAIVGDAELDIRPLTEPWDLGMAPKPPGLATARYMIAHKSDRQSEAGTPLEPAKAAGLARLLESMRAAGVLLSTVSLSPSSEATRLRFSKDKAKPVAIDGPFTESKELIGGFVIVDVASREAALGWADPYGKALGDVEIDVRRVEEEK